MQKHMDTEILQAATEQWHHPSRIAHTGSLIIHKAYCLRIFLLQETANKNIILANPSHIPEECKHDLFAGPQTTDN
jgi:hypothetical protein